MRMFWALLVTVVGLAAAEPASAATEAAPACAAIDATPPPELAGWTTRADLVSAARAADLSAAVLRPGQAVSARLHPTRQVKYVAQPEKPGGSVAYGGMLRVRIATAGTYRVILDSRAWIDVLKDGRAIASTAHAPGPACTTARKTVEFPLTPGDYVLQVSANADPALAILIIPRP